MLNLKEIAQRIERPEICREEDIDDLKLFTSTYPYSQIFPILYLKALSIQNDIRFEGELAKYAFQISDRAQLFHLIHQKELTDIEGVNLGSETIEDKAPHTIAPEFKEVEMRVVSALPEEEIFTSDAGLNEIANEDLEAEISEEELVETNSHLIQTEVHSASDKIELVEDDETDEEVEDVFIPLNITTLEINTESDSQEKIDVVQDKPITQKELEDNFDKELLSEAIVANYNLDHLSPIESNELSEHSEIEVPIEPKEEIHRISEDQDKRTFASWLRSNDKYFEPQVDEEKARLDAIVNKFIKDEPKISRPSKEQFDEEKPKKEFFSPVRKAKESLDMNTMPVSETLAKIFALQGNYPKAIFAYEQLILINPEKKIFFASQIDELKKKLNT